VRAHRDLSPTVREFEIRPEGGVRPWTVGSHLNVQVQIDDREETRSYSLVGLPGDPEAYRIAVKLALPSRGGSRHMWSLETGAEPAVGEPANHVELPLGATQYLLVAGGIGITPLIGMQMLARVPMRMLYAGSAEFALKDVLEARSVSACRPRRRKPASASLADEIAPCAGCCC
jgi:vanillate O-demethylase ferredoxin subunit